jgi:hypothetical protein
MTSQMKPQHYQQVEEIQEEVSYQNEIGIDLLRMGKTKTALFHFSHGLQAMQRLSIIKKKTGCQNPQLQCSSTVARPGRPLPIDTLSSASTEKWEVFGSVALMHNSALAHHQDQSYDQAKQMLSLAVKLLRSDISPAALNQMLHESMYAATVMVSVYAMLGKTLSQLSPDEENSKEAKKAFTAASGLKKRFMSAKSFSKRISKQSHVASVSCQLQEKKGQHRLGSNFDVPPPSPSTVMSVNDSSARSRATISVKGCLEVEAPPSQFPFINKL